MHGNGMVANCNYTEVKFWWESEPQKTPIQPNFVGPNFLRSFSQNYYIVLFAIERATEPKILLHTSFSEIYRTFLLNIMILFFRIRIISTAVIN